MKSPFGKRLRIPLIGLALVSGLVLAGCGSSASSPTTASTNGRPAKDLVDEAKTKVAEFSKASPDSDWPMPTDAYTPGQGRMSIISCGEQGADCHAGATFVAEAARAAGWTPSPIYDGKFTPSEQAAGIEKALQSKSKAVVLVAMDLDSIKAAVQSALDAKVAVTCLFCNPGSFGDQIVNATYDLPKAGEAVAWALIARGAGPVKALAFNDTAFPQAGQKLAGLKDTLEKECSDCSYKETPIPTGDLVKPGPPTFTAAMSANPKGTVTDVIAPYDLFAAPMAKTSLQLNRSEVKVSGFEVTKETAQGLTSGSLPMEASTSSPYEYWSWLAADAAMRQAANAPKWSPGPTPFVLVTAANAGQFVDKYYAPGFDFKAKFGSLWKK